LNSKLKNALNICNDMFSDDLAWNKLPDSSKLIFAQALLSAHEELKKIPAEAGLKPNREGFKKLLSRGLGMIL
jgi:hypothetical protein